MGLQEQPGGSCLYDQPHWKQLVAELQAMGVEMEVATPNSCMTSERQMQKPYHLVGINTMGALQGLNRHKCPVHVHAARVLEHTGHHSQHHCICVWH